MKNFIKGKFSRSIYENESGYRIGIFKVYDTSDETLSDYVGKSITFTGYFHELNMTDTYLFYGKKIVHTKYGEQFQVENYERCKPEEKDSIVEFLTSGLFKGIGEKKAKSIVNVLGKDTLNIILRNPDNLILIPGITKKNIEVLHNQLKEYESSYETIIYLSDIGFSNKDSMIIYNYYKKKTKDILEENIYQIIDDILDMNFKKVDTIALKRGINPLSPIRIQAALLYIMQEVSNTYGHAYYYKEELSKLLPRVLGTSVSDDVLDDLFIEMENDSKIVIKEDRYYLKEMYDDECFIVKRFRLLNNNKGENAKNVFETINDLESFFSIKYNLNQRDAIYKSYIKDFLIITGGPGTGKTTIMNGVLELYRQMKKLSYEKLQDKVALLAPTGRAAKRLSEATHFPASTIHRFLKWQKEQNRFQVNQYNKSKVEFVIVDEASMIDTHLMASLLRGISSNCKIVLVGDDHQLPSVGPGQVLKDVIESGKLEMVELTELYRQKENSNIISLAYDIRHQTLHKDIFNIFDDLTFIECKDLDVIQNICEICTTYKDYDYKKIQILAPMYKGINGIDLINRNVKSIFNPKDSSKKELLIGDVDFLEDDKVIQLTNMPDENVYNGDIGLIERIEGGSKKEVHIDFDGNRVKYTPSNFSNFRLAYSISIHKSQGSEFDIVILPIVKGYRKMLYQKLIYTAVTRAKQKLYIIGEYDALDIAIHNTSDDVRRTTIMEYLISGIK